MSFIHRNLRKRTRDFFRTFLYAGVLIGAAAEVRAQGVDAGESAWSISGFGTLGAVKTNGGNGWGFVRNKSQNGAASDLSATPDSRLGLQLNWNGGPRWEAGIQAVLQDTPSGVSAQEAVQWAYVGYRPLPNTRIRVGRISPDIFLFADSRNVGFALPWARPPVDFYGFAPLTSIDGLDLEQRWVSGDASWRARLTAGTVDTSVSNSSSSGVGLRGRDTLALALSREDDGLLVKLSYARSRMNVDVGSGVDQLRQGLDSLGALPVPGLANSISALERNLWTGGAVSYLALAAQYETGPWTLIAEGSELSVPRSPLNARRAYGSVGYRSGGITYYGLASRVKPTHGAVSDPALGSSLAPVIGLQAAQQAQALADYAATAGNNYRFDQTTVGVGMRWDFAANAALKLQLDRFDIHRNGGAGWRGADGRSGQGTLVSVLVDFVWGP